MKATASRNTAITPSIQAGGTELPPVFIFHDPAVKNIFFPS